MTTTTTPKKRSPRKPKTIAHLLLDMTGSMEGIRQITISAFNEYLDGLKKDKATAEMEMGVSFFNSLIGVEEKVSSRKVKDLPPLDLETYRPDGMTPLYDAIGHTISKMASTYKKGMQALLVIQTDGHENSSKEWSNQKIIDLIKEKESQGWQFLFLGADLDAMSVGQQFGIDAGQTLSYAGADQFSTRQAVSDSLSRVTAYAASGQSVNRASTADYRPGTAGPAPTPKKPKEYGE